MTTPGFPNLDALCEDCGYPLKGLGAGGDCPECGTAVAASDPVHRPGLPWQLRRGAGGWWVTTRLMMMRPGTGFRQMRLDGSARRDTVYLLTFALALPLVGALAWQLFGQSPEARSGWAWLWGLELAVLIMVLSAVEAAGVVWFARRRGWMVRWRTAWAVACYAAVGWVPATLTIVALGLVPPSLWPSGKIGQMVVSQPFIRLVAAVGVFAIGLLWFETLVWLGVRRARFANQAPGGD